MREANILLTQGLGQKLELGQKTQLSLINSGKLSMTCRSIRTNAEIIQSVISAVFCILNQLDCSKSL